jgi:hypothetical protein
MYIPFTSLPDSARLWIYQSSRPLQMDEVELISAHLHRFTENWAAHGAPLKASYTIAFQRFIILAVDEAHHLASGCSIDASVSVIRELQSLLNLDLFDRMQIAFRDDSGMIASISPKIFQSEIAKGNVNEDTLVFNNMIDRVGDLKNKWEVPVKNSWHKRYLKAIETSTH